MTLSLINILATLLISLQVTDCKFEIDRYGLTAIAAAATGSSAATAIGTWTGTPTTGESWVFKKYEWLDKLEVGNNNIISKTKRANANFIICGNNVARLIRQMEGHFVPASGLDKNIPTGPFELGTLNGRMVIQDPFMTTDRYIMGFRGDNYLFAGAIYAPYIPLFATPTVILGNLQAQKGFMSSAGFKVINAGMYTYGDIDLSGI